MGWGRRKSHLADGKYGDDDPGRMRKSIGRRLRSEVGSRSKTEIKWLSFVEGKVVLSGDERFSAAATLMGVPAMD
jgi:hypothetical protein